MKNQKISYENLAANFDHDRALTQVKKTLWQELIDKVFRLSQNSSILDIGCGTGRFAELFESVYHCNVVGLDPSPAMISQAKTKNSREIKWILGKAENLPFLSNTFDLCFASQVIQHFNPINKALQETYNVLRNGAQVGIRASSHAQLQTILDYRFFPSGIEIEHERLPDIPVIEKMLLDIGFREIQEYLIKQPLFESPYNYLEKLRNKYASFLFLISEEEFQKGLNYATEYLQTDFSPEERYAEITLLVGCK